MRFPMEDRKALVFVFGYVLTLLTLLVLFPDHVQAQTTQDGFVRPPDVPAYVEMFDGYAAGTTENTVGDGSTARGGTMPVLATMPADIPAVASGWITSASGTSDYETVTDPATEEVKFRTIANHSHVNFDDPIRNWGQPGTAHCHTFFGNNQTNAFSTYASMRTRANSRAAASKVASTTAGGPYNATGYWHPCIIKPNAFGDGKNYAHKASTYTLYYNHNPATPALFGQRLPRGLRYIFGTNMSDPYDVAFKARIATANAQPATSPTRYAYAGNGFLGWRCRAPDESTVRTRTVAEHPQTPPVATGQNFYPGFTTSGAADPWGGNCVSGDWLVAEFNGPTCYDGNNLWSPGGYKHLIPGVTDTVGTAGSKGCPNGWFRAASLLITMWFKHQGPSDYMTWYLSSDAAATTAAQNLDGGAAAMLPGQSMHTDWMNGWDDTTLMKWQNDCFGVNGATMHICASGRLDADERLLGGAGGDAPDGSRTPQNSGDEDYTTDVRADMVQVPASLTGPHVIQVN